LTASAITFTGQDALGRKADEILAMAARAADTAPAWRAWGDDVEHAFREQFDSQGVRLTGEVWAPLSPRYAAWKARHFPGMPILRRTDVLFASMTHRPMAVERVTGHSGESELPPDDAWWPYEGHPVDRWPVINCSIEESSTSWGEVDTTTDFDSVVYWTTYSCSAYVWVNVDGRQQAVDVRDDLQVAMRVALLGQQLSADPPMTVLRNRYRDVYGSPLPAKGQRFTIAGRSAFSVRVEERISRVALVTVAASSDIEVDLDVTSVPLGDHPALQ
jgi:hypothetical protein